MVKIYVIQRCLATAVKSDVSLLTGESLRPSEILLVVIDGAV